jgi:hypothetical protein
MLNVLILGEESGTVRDAFIAKGHSAISCDYKPTAKPGPHFQGDFYDILFTREWDLVIAHPTCTCLCVSGNSTYAEGKPKYNERLAAAAWTAQLWRDIKKVSLACCLENPVGVLPKLTDMGGATQYIQPNEHGHYESKKTGLWLYNLPKLVPTHKLRIPACGYWNNQTLSGQNKLGPSDQRAALRSKTYQGIADAMAEQWTEEIILEVLK